MRNRISPKSRRVAALRRNFQKSGNRFKGINRALETFDDYRRQMQRAGRLTPKQVQMLSDSLGELTGTNSRGWEELGKGMSSTRIDEAVRAREAVHNELNRIFSRAEVNFGRAKSQMAMFK